MYRGFDVRLGDLWFDSKPKYREVGQAIFDANKLVAKQTLNALRDPSGDLNADAIMKEWFPDVKPHVFISHSHQDSVHAITMAGWLESRFKLSAFVDSCAWGYADDLLAEIDKKYCWRPETETFSYEMRNKSTAHVHIMLNSALMRLMNSAECVFFINSPNSISTQNYIRSEQTTDSPWLFSELTITRLIQKRWPHEHRGKKVMIKSARTHDAAMEAIQIEYPADTHHLTPLAAPDLQRWDEDVPMYHEDPATTLDVLYGIAPEKPLKSG